MSDIPRSVTLEIELRKLPRSIAHTLFANILPICVLFFFLPRLHAPDWLTYLFAAIWFVVYLAYIVITRSTTPDPGNPLFHGKEFPSPVILIVSCILQLAVCIVGVTLWTIWFK